jgi:predicted RND superfamily exporter protein
LKRFATFVLLYPKSVLAGLFILMVVALYPASGIRTDFNLEAFFPDDDRTIIEYRAVSEEFGRDDNVIALLLEHPDLLSIEHLTRIDSLTQALKSMNHVTDVESLTEARGLANRDDNLVVESVWEPGEPAPSLDSLLNNPFLKDILISRDGSASAIYITIDAEADPFRIRGEVIESMRSILEPYMGMYDVGITGIPYFRNEYVNMLNHEIFFYITLSTFLVMMLLVGLFQSVRGVVLPLGIVWLTILFTLAIMVLTGGYFEILSSTIAPILLCVGISDSVHILSKYNDGRLGGLSRRSAMKDTVMVMGRATFLTSITTFIGFATLLTSSVVPIQRFGLYTAIGVMVAYVVTMFAIPAALPFFKDKNPKDMSGHAVHVFLGRHLMRLNDWIESHHKAIVIGTLVLTVVIGFGAVNLKVNSFIFDDVGPESVLMQDSDRFSEKLSPPFPLELVLNTETDNGILQPDYIQRLMAFEAFLDSIPEMARSTSIITLLRETHHVMQPDAPLEALFQPDAAPLIAQYMLLLEMADPDLLPSFTDFTYRKVRIAAQVEDAGSYRINGIRRDIRLYLKENFPESRLQQSGTSILVSDLTGNMVRSLTSSILLAVLFIGFIMAWMFRNGKLIAISLIPNLVPLFMVAGVMGYFGIDLKPSTAVIFTIAFGIAVDDTIHFLARLRLESWKDQDLRTAIRITTEKTGRAILLTSIILLTGFGTLMTSDFTSTVWMGSLVSLTIFVALLADVVFLPALLYWMKPDLKPKA